jgi:hypothetical protein
MVPTVGLTVHRIPVLVVPLTDAENCLVCPAVSVAFNGETATLIPWPDDTAGDTVTDAPLVIPSAVAVTWTAVVWETEFTFSVNEAAVAPPGTITLDGRLTLAPVTEKPSDTGNPLPVAAPVRATVHRADPGAVTAVGLQLTPERETGRSTVTVAPVPEDPMFTPAGDAAPASSIWIELEVAVVPEATVTAAVASVPEAIFVLLMPEAIQVYRPGAVAAHWTPLPAPVAAGPAVTEILEKSEAEYASVHIRLLTWAPAVWEIGREMELPGCPEPPARVIVCALSADPPAISARRQKIRVPPLKPKAFLERIIKR